MAKLSRSATLDAEYTNELVTVKDNHSNGSVSSPWATITGGGSSGMTVKGGTLPVTVDLSTVSGSATLVYEVRNVNGIVTVTQRDLTNATDLNVVQQALVNGTDVKSYGVPTTSGAVAAYVLFYYTGTLPQ